MEFIRGIIIMNLELSQISQVLFYAKKEPIQIKQKGKTNVLNAKKIVYVQEDMSTSTL